MDAKLTAQQSTILAMVGAAKQGVTSAQVGTQLGVLPKTAAIQLWHLSQLGLVSSVRARHHSVWCTPERWQDIRASIIPKQRGQLYRRTMPARHTHSLTERQADILNTMSAHIDGIGGAELAAIFKTNRVNMAEAMRRLRVRGFVAVVRAGAFSAWCLIEQRDATIKRLQREQAERDHERQRRRYAQEQAKAADESDDPLLLIRRAIVPAATAPRIETRGVASVFDLAHAA